MPSPPPPSPTYTLDLPAPEARASSAPPPEAIDTEWLLTNGLGSFALGTACGCNTRRYHGLLIAAQRPPIQRVNTLAAVHETVRFGGQSFELACHEFATPDGPTIFHPKGWRYLRRFEKDTACRWYFEVGPIRIVKELRLAWKRNLSVLTYRVEPIAGPSDGPGDTPEQVTLQLLPLVALRDFHRHRRFGAGAGDAFHVHLEEHDGGASALRITAQDAPVEGASPLHLLIEPGAFIEQPNWWYGFKHRIETRRGQDDVEDLYSPGRFEHTFTGVGGAVCEMKMHIGTAPIDRSGRDDGHGEGDGRDAILRKTIAHVRSMPPAGDPAPAPRPLAGLTAAANDFVVERAVGGERMTSIIAGYPWFADWGRDAMISLPGLLLCTGRFDEARRTLTTYARHIRRGLIPNRFDDYGGQPHYNTADASLWYIHAALEYLRLTDDRDAWNDTLANACRRIIDGYRAGTDGDIRMDRDGLIAAGNEHTQLTWMDAKWGDTVFTPRHGKAVEINALWHRALAGCADALADTDTAAAEDFRKLAAKVKRSFNRTFWDERLGHLVDHVNEHGPHRSLRPNQVLAVSLPHSPLPRTRQKRVMKAVREKLLTPMGLRTLSPDDANYHGRCGDSMFERDRAYHQGTIWAWLIGPYIEGYLRAHNFAPAACRHARDALAPLLQEPSRRCLGQLYETFEGDPPHAPGGCPAQAWSVAETLRAALLIGGERDRRERDQGIRDRGTEG